MDATTVGVDLAKTVFELAVANAVWHVVGRKRLTRPQFERFLATQPATHLVMEACGTAHHWTRIARTYGHRVTLLPAQYVRPSVRRNKTDRTDAEALLEALRSGRIDQVVVKTVAQQELQRRPRCDQQDGRCVSPVSADTRGSRCPACGAPCARTTTRPDATSAMGRGAPAPRHAVIVIDARLIRKGWRRPRAVLSERSPRGPAETTDTGSGR
jgi:Transposase